MAACRYQHGVKCDGPGSLDLSLCHESSCRGPVNLRPDDESREEPMPKNEAAPVGKCPECGRDGKKLRETKHKPGVRVCDTCIARISYHATKGAKPAPKIVADPQPKKSEPKVQPAAGNGNGHSISITFRVQIEPGTTALELMDIIRALPAGAVVA